MVGRCCSDCGGGSGVGCSHVDDDAGDNGDAGCAGGVGCDDRSGDGCWYWPWLWRGGSLGTKLYIAMHYDNIY